MAGGIGPAIGPAVAHPGGCCPPEGWVVTVPGEEPGKGSRASSPLPDRRAHAIYFIPKGICNSSLGIF